MVRNCFFILLLVGYVGQALAQTAEMCQPLLNQIGDFEGRRDPKCAATANRLEDFMYGTPLEESARIRKADLQKELILRVWKQCDSLDRMLGLKEISVLTMKSVVENRMPFKETEKTFEWNGTGNTDFITKRDLAHYSAVAYAYRAILSVQQDALFDSELHLLPLTGIASKVLKEQLDKLTLLVLKIADKQSRLTQEKAISPEVFESAWRQVISSQNVRQPKLSMVSNTKKNAQQLELVNAIIQKKKEAFQEYNHISMFLFQRNAQVYFSRHGWPKDEKENEQFRALYNETLIQFVKDMWLMAQGFAAKENSPLIRLEHISAALELFLPYEANQLEDITFFPKLIREKQIDVEAYDLDAFRDGGVHWTYIEMALGDSGFNPSIMPDPFALELLSEGIAHMGVLTLRVAGNKSKELGHERLSREDFVEGLKHLQSLITESGSVQTKPPKSSISSAEVKKVIPKGQLFTESTVGSGIDFEHRSADWLSRFIRSYRVDSSENLVKTTIPPAFGGGGVAAEDLNNDGWPDVLLLSGLGNKLFLNNGDGTFVDNTTQAGLDWNRTEDKLPGEPRQPIIADFDNDGLQDIFISYVNDNHRIYRNTGNATFEDVTALANFGGKGSVGGPATAIDYDNDGLLDIYIGYFGDYLNAVHPTLARRNRNGLANHLFKNLGGFKFQKVEGAGIEDFGWSQSIGHADINGDNLQDLICGNDFGTNSYYINNGDGTFTDKSHELGTDKPSFTMNVGVTDLNQDHLPDFYISNIVVMEKDEKYVNPTANSPMRFNAESVVNMRVVEANDLFVSGKSTTGTDYSLSTDISRGYSSTGWSWDADFFDYDNDGDQDLYCLTGMNDFLVYSTENPYFEDKEGIGKKVFFAESHRESNVFFENENGKLVSGNENSGLDVVYNSRSAAFLDYDRDGDQDIILNNYHDKAILFKNNSEKNENNWLKIRLVGNPEKGITRDAIGAKITVTATGLAAWYEIHSTTGYLSVHPKEQMIGVGAHQTVDVSVIWPNGEEENFTSVNTNKRYELTVGGKLIEKK
jgi:hypothetical protein